MTGFDNENQIIDALNNVQFNKINNNLKKAVLKINNNKIPSIILAKKYGGKDKADLSFIIDGNEHSISVKMGSGNSIHQEPIEDFILYLKNNLEDNQSVFDDLRHFIWGDKSLDGKGKISDRINASDYKKDYPLKVNNIQSYFNNHIDALLKRFLITGTVSSKKADFLLYGDITKCTIISENDLLNYAKSHSKRPISIGVLNFQTWNRILDGNPKHEHKRGQIQLKWGTLKKDIEKI